MLVFIALRVAHGLLPEAHGLLPETQVVRLRQVVRPRLLNDWTESLMQSARSQGGGFFMIGRCLLAQVTMKQLIILACSQMGEIYIPSSQSDEVGLQPVWGLFPDWAVLAGPGDNEAIIGLQPDG